MSVQPTLQQVYKQCYRLLQSHYERVNGNTMWTSSLRRIFKDPETRLQIRDVQNVIVFLESKQEYQVGHFYINLFIYLYLYQSIYIFTFL